MHLNYIFLLISFLASPIFCLSVLIPENEITYSSKDAFNHPIDHKLGNQIGILNGIFIEVGAYDGIFQSNTKLLEDFYGWTGILIEPSPSLYKRLVNNRPHSKCFQCALGSFGQADTYINGDFDGSLMSSVDGARRNQLPNEIVLIRTLQSILDEEHLTYIDFFSLDVEGYELNILKGIDFNKTKFRYILIEIYNSLYDEIIEFMKLNGYVLMENFSQYNSTTNPDWDGSHNDYLFQQIQSED